MRMINFAHGRFDHARRLCAVVPSASDVAPPLIGAWPGRCWFLPIIVIVSLAALLTERFAFRPLRRREVDGATLLISSFAISYLLQSVVLFVYTGRPKSVSIFPELTQQINSPASGWPGRRRHHRGYGAAIAGAAVFLLYARPG